MMLETIHVGYHLLDQNILAPLCQKWGNKTALIVDEALLSLYGIPLAQKLNAKLFSVPSGERCKTRETKEKIEDALLQEGYGRDTVLVALGGGATTDLTGFIASTYLRGVSLIFVPTTLLAMVDAAIGGKVAINTPLGKNLIGSFYSPKAIICDLQVLQTLPEQEWFHGLAEILKIGLVSDRTIWEKAKKNIKDETLIRQAIEKKLEIVKLDPFEKGMRRILNFGHTIGHGLEQMSSYTMPHGQAVFLGLLAEAHLSMQLGFLSQDDFEKIHSFYKTFAFLLPWPKNQEALFHSLFFDKKKENGQIRFVLIDKIGQALCFDNNYCTAVHEENLKKTFVWMEENYG